MESLPVWPGPAGHRTAALIGKDRTMKFLLFLACWCLLFLLCWPAALVIAVLIPILWLMLLPFRLAWMVTEAALAFVKVMLFLPARLLGHRGS